MSDKLHSLKLEKGEYEGPSMISSPEYPYGLEICLDECTLEKLGIEELPKVGDMVMISAMAKVCAVSEREMRDDEMDRRMSLQITEMGLGAPKKAIEDEAIEKLYRKG